MNLELFPEIEPSRLDDLLREIDGAVDACFLADVEVALEKTRTPGDPVPDTAAA